MRACAGVRHVAQAGTAGSDLRGGGFCYDIEYLHGAIRHARRIVDAPMGTRHMLRSEPASNRAEAIIASLRRHRILGNAPADELQAMLRRSMVVTVPEREALFAEGSEGRAAVVVLQGYVKLRSTTAAERHT